MNKKLYEVTVRIWDDYIIEVDAETEEDAESYVEEHINEVEKIGMNSNGGRDVESIEEIE